MEQSIRLMGNYLPECRYIPSGHDPLLIFQDSGGKSYFGIDEDTLYRNILLMGASGSGKTTIINQIFAQLRSPADQKQYFALVFDTKGDYINHRNFYRRGDYVIGNSRDFRSRSAVWNIFEEVLADGDEPEDYEANAREIAAVLFHGRGSRTQPFFVNAARDLFANTIIYFIRRRNEQGGEWNGNLNNRALKTFLLSYEAGDLARFFRRYPDMRGLVSYFGDGSSNQSLGVFGELRSMLYDCFQGVFAMDPKDGPSFSIRKAVRRKNNHALFIEYDMAIGESMTPMYRLLVDLALKEALSTQATPGRTCLFLDELKLLPQISHLQDALNFGRSHEVTITGGIQTVDQLYTNYGEHPAQEILEGFGSLIALKTTDYASREYISRRFGPNVTSYRYHNISGQPLDREREGYVVEHWTQQELDRGQAVVGLASQKEPFLFRFGPDRFA